MDIEEGAVAPNFTLTDSHGTLKTLHEIEGRKIVYFFPIAFGNESIQQAKSFQDSYQRLRELDIIEIIGVSIDDQQKLNEFKLKCKLEFILVSDQAKKISKSYGVFRNRIIIKYAARITFLIGRDNKIEKIYSGGFLNEDTEIFIETYANNIEKDLGVSVLKERLGSKIGTSDSKSEIKID